MAGQAKSLPLEFWERTKKPGRGFNCKGRKAGPRTPFYFIRKSHQCSRSCISLRPWARGTERVWKRRFWLSVPVCVSLLQVCAPWLPSSSSVKPVLSKAAYSSTVSFPPQTSLRHNSLLQFSEPIFQCQNTSCPPCSAQWTLGQWPRGGGVTALNNNK